MNKYAKHFITVTKHKWVVMKCCFKAGLYWQGIKHDMSKYSIVEFYESAKYFNGNMSPIDATKEANGYSLAWQHHKGHNPHHWEYWIDYKNGGTYALKMPLNYVYEAVCDFVGAGVAYNKDKWTQSDPINYHMKTRGNRLYHADTDNLLTTIFKDIEDNGLDYVLYLMRKKYYTYPLKNNSQWRTSGS